MTPLSPAAARPPAAVTLATLGRAVRRYLLVFLLFVVAAACAGATVWFFLPLPNWTGVVTYRVTTVAPGVLNPSAASPLDFTTYKQQQGALLRNKVLMNAVLSDPAVATLKMLSPAEVDDPAAWLAANIRIDYPLGPEYMRLAVEGDDPVQLSVLMKALNAAYLKEVDARDRGSRLDRLDQLRKYQEGYDSKLRESRGKIISAMKRLNASDPVTLMYREQFLQQQINNTKNQLANIVTNIRDSKVDAAMSGLAPGAVPTPVDIAETMVEESVRKHPETVELQAQSDKLATYIAQETLRVVPGKSLPYIDKAKAEKVKVDEKLKQLPTRLRVEVRSQLKTELEMAARTRAVSYSEKMKLLSGYQKALVDDFERQVAEQKSLTDVSSEIVGMRNDVAEVEAMANQVTRAIEAIKPELDAPRRVTVWEEPAATPGIEGKRRAKYTGMAVGALLVLGLALVQWLEYNGRRVLTLEEAARGTGMAVIGTVPFIPKTGRGADQDVWTHLLTEAVNTTRTMILNPQAHPTAPPPRTILVTSASSSEGKTSVSTHLAVSLAGAGRRVLLIDADMRRPTAHLVLGLPAEPGLGEYLIGECEAGAIRAETRVDGLSFVPAGSWHPAAAAALTTERWLALLRASAAEFDFVLIDSPPVLPVADALSIARTVDAVLFAVMRDRSRVASVNAACGRLQMVGARMLGIVLSGALVTRGEYYDKYYHRGLVAAQPAR